MNEASIAIEIVFALAVGLLSTFIQKNPSYTISYLGVASDLTATGLAIKSSSGRISGVLFDVGSSRRGESHRIMEKDVENRRARTGADTPERSNRRTEKRERFVRVAEKRTRAVLERLRLLGKCGNPAVYEYDDEQVEQIFSAIEEELKASRAKFDRKRTRSFRLR